MTAIASPSIDEAAAPPLFRQPSLTLAEAATLPVALHLRYIAWLRIAGHLAAATAHLDQVEAENGASAALLDERAALALSARDSAAVHAAWQRRLENNPAPSAEAAFARALLELGRVEEAAEIAEALLATHDQLATVHALAADVALQQGDLAPAHDFWAGQLAQDPSRVSPALALAKITLLGGDPEEARRILHGALHDPETLTAAQLSAACGLAEMLGQPARGQELRQRMVRLEVSRAAALAAEIDAALGREPGDVSQVPAGAAVPALTPVQPPPRPQEPPIAQHADAVVVDEEPEDPRILPTLHSVFGYEDLLPGQAAVINSVLAGRDTLAILPTGAGKSLTFQLSSLLLPGATLVLSPLIALMKDQVESLPDALRAQTALLNSTVSAEEQRRTLDEIANGRCKLVYAAPERLRQPAFLRALRRGGISLVVVDEAHCISLWGHDFRPDYLSIPASLPELGNPPLLAMTATASPETAAMIGAAFRRDLHVVRTSAYRANLYYAAERLGTKEEKARRVVSLCRELPGQGIVYVSSRRDAENLAGVLRDNGVGAVAYHAGLARDVREGNQDRFMRGNARVVVATIAFGMGIDKSDVRFIIHFSPSTSLEAYAQESGRAGRDGEPSRCVILYTSSDRATQTRLANRDAMDLAMLRQVFAGIREHAIGSWAIFDPSRIAISVGPLDDPDDLPDPRIGIGLLEQGGFLERHANAPVTWTLARAAAPEADIAADFGEDASLWERFAAWAELPERPGAEITVQTAAACSALGIVPETLARLLDQHPGWQATAGHRLPCLHLLPIEANAAARLQRVLNEAMARSKARVDRIMTYAEGKRCRHAELASYLGESLPPCGEACDVCSGDTRAASPARREKQAARRAKFTPEDVDTTLRAMLTLPFPVGKTGLTRLLEGSVQSRIQADRSAQFGALADLRKSQIEAIVDSLVEDNQAVYDRSRDFPVLKLTPSGAERARDLMDSA